MATSPGLRVLYLGDDKAYLKVLVGEIKRLQSALPVVFESLFEKTPERIQGLVPRVLALKPALVLIDFSKHTEDFVHLARLLAHINTAAPLPLLGLHDYLTPPEQMLECFLSGVKMNHIKSAEVFDPAFGALQMLSPDKPAEHGFATADLEEPISVFHMCKVGFINETCLHFETHLNPSNGSELRMRHHWQGPKLIPSGLLTVKSISTAPLFYNFPRAVDAEFAFVDPIVTSEGDDPAHVKELREERDHAIIKARKTLKSWIEDNMDRSKGKSVRVLVVDRTMAFLRDRERSDKYGWSIRCQPFLKDVPTELAAGKPQVIAFALDKPAENKDAIVDFPNDMKMLRQIVDASRKAEEPPFLVVFNAQVSSKDLQREMNWPQCMAVAGELGPEVLLKMAAMFAGKIKLTAAVGGDDGHTVYIKKNHPMSIAEVEQDATFKKLSETDAVIESPHSLPNGTVLRVRGIFEGFLTIVAHPEHGGKGGSYYALINGVGEEGKMALRRYVNSLFFKDHDAEKQAELDSFQEINKTKLEERLKAEQERRLAEEAAAKEAAAKAEAEKKAAAAAAANPTPPDDDEGKQAG